ncbi:MAG TPA: histidine phosphatase family protein [Candidatus Dormibacteraeota bacterium]|nr:histidine phosphatase family protein [Candidatus Dormibacteraeota bacterium]
MRSLEALFLIGIEDVTEIWLVRHGDCYEGMADGPDPPLSPLGRKQAAQLADRVRRLKPAAVYSSPYRRALETARAITDDLRADPRLVEMALDLSDEGQLDFKESPSNVIERMRAAIDDIAHAHSGQRVIVVGHGAAIVTYVTDVLRLEPGQLRLLPYYTSVSIVRALGDRRVVAGFGDVAHLE